MVRNPMNYNQVSKISLSPELVDCIVFWSKNPAPMMRYLNDISKDYPFYFQFTINAYGNDLEPGLPPLKNRVQLFAEISARYAKSSVVWRYDPVILTDQYTPEWHIEAFSRIAEQLKGYTDTCVFSFVDLYDKVKKNLKQISIKPFPASEIEYLAKHFSEIALANGISLNTCAEKVDLSSFQIGHSCCIDRNRIERILGCEIKAKKDPNQRQECGCVESVDIGQYNTCMHGCKYCYANYSRSSVLSAVERHNIMSPLLVGDIADTDMIKERIVKSIKEPQISLF